MENVKEIKKPSFRLVRDAEHYHYHDNVLKAITPITAKEYKMESLRYSYEKLFKREESAFMRDRAFEETKEIQAADKKRDELFCFIKRTIELMKYNPDASIKAYWSVLDEGMSPYKNAHRKSFVENTTMVTLFIEEMKKEQYGEALKSLDLVKVFDLLHDANAKCEDLYNERLSAKQKRNEEEKMRNIRPRVDKVFFDIIKFINAIYLVSHEITKEDQVLQEIGVIIDKVNVHTQKLMASIKERRLEVES